MTGSRASCWCIHLLLTVSFSDPGCLSSAYIYMRLSLLLLQDLTVPPCRCRQHGADAHLGSGLASVPSCSHLEPHTQKAQLEPFYVASLLQQETNPSLLQSEYSRLRSLSKPLNHFLYERRLATNTIAVNTACLLSRAVRFYNSSPAAVRSVVSEASAPLLYQDDGHRPLQTDNCMHRCPSEVCVSCGWFPFLDL